VLFVESKRIEKGIERPGVGTKLAEGLFTMKSARRLKMLLAVLIVVLAGTISAQAASQTVGGGFIYNLASFTGPIPYNQARVTVDRQRNETYVLSANNLRIFNDAGMEIYQFGDDLDLGQIVDVAVDEDGDVLLLAYKESRGSVVRCDFRGQPKATIDLRGLPKDFLDFSPNRMIYQQGTLYFASTSGLKVVVTDREGNFEKGYDIFSLLELEEKDRGTVEIIGFSVDRDRNILMTVPVLFRAFTMSPAGEIKYFGRPGSAPGRFNIIAGISRDSRGNYLVVDRLKCAVLVFDKNFKFLAQFGGYGKKAGNLAFPDEIAVDNADRIYVTQMGRRGVSVYRLTAN
jgi:hypothetical protein